MNSPFRCAASCFLHIYTFLPILSFVSFFPFPHSSTTLRTHDENGIWSCREVFCWLDLIDGWMEKRDDAELHFFSVYFFVYACSADIRQVGWIVQIHQWKLCQIIQSMFCSKDGKTDPIDNRSTMRKSVDLVAVQCSKSHTKWMCATDTEPRRERLEMEMDVSESRFRTLDRTCDGGPAAQLR